MGNAAGLDAQPPVPPASFRTLEDAERFKRSVILRPELEAAKVLRPDAPELVAARGHGSDVGPGDAEFRALQRPERARERRGSCRRAADWRRCGSATGTPDRAVAGRACTWRLAVAGAAAGTRSRCSGRLRSSGRASSTRSTSSWKSSTTQRTKSAAARPTYDPSLDAIQPALARSRAGCVRGPAFPRDPARAEHGEGVQPGSRDHRRA